MNGGRSLIDERELESKPFFLSWILAAVYR